MKNKNAAKLPPPKPELTVVYEDRPPEFFVIRHKPSGTWWGPNGAGYSSELLSAGAYTEAEAQRWASNRPEEDEAMPLQVALRDFVSGLNPMLIQAIAALGAR